MRSRIVAVGMVALLGLVAAGCGDSSSGGKAAADGPSAPAKLACSKEAQTDVQGALLQRTTAPVRPVWKRPDYSCTYRYATGSFTLSVRDLPDATATQAYFDRLVAAHGRDSTASINADQAFLLKDGSLVARRKLHVLFVDVSHLPARFGKPSQAQPRAQVAFSIGGVIMACWNGDT